MLVISLSAIVVVVAVVAVVAVVGDVVSPAVLVKGGRVLLSVLAVFIVVVGILTTS